MPVAAAEPEEPEEPDIVVYAYSPRLYNALRADLRTDDLASLLAWRDELVAIAECISDVDKALPGLGLTLPRLVELVQHAWEAEEAEQAHRWHGDFRSREAQAPAMRKAIVSLHLRGLPRDRIRWAMSVDPAWVDHAIAHADITDLELAVVRAHIAGGTQAEIARDTGAPRTTVENILGRRLGEHPRRQTFQATAERRRKVWRLKDAGRTVTEICKLLDLPKRAVLYDLSLRSNRGPAE